MADQLSIIRRHTDSVYELLRIPTTRRDPPNRNIHAIAPVRNRVVPVSVQTTARPPPNRPATHALPPPGSNLLSLTRPTTSSHELNLYSPESSPVPNVYSPLPPSESYEPYSYIHQSVPPPVPQPVQVPTNTSRESPSNFFARHARNNPLPGEPLSLNQFREKWGVPRNYVPVPTTHRLDQQPINSLYRSMQYGQRSHHLFGRPKIQGPKTQSHDTSQGFRRAFTKPRFIIPGSETNNLGGGYRRKHSTQRRQKRGKVSHKKTKYGRLTRRR